MMFGRKRDETKKGFYYDVTVVEDVRIKAFVSARLIKKDKETHMQIKIKVIRGLRKYFS